MCGQELDEKIIADNVKVAELKKVSTVININEAVEPIDTFEVASNSSNGHGGHASSLDKRNFKYNVSLKKLTDCKIITFIVLAVYQKMFRNKIFIEFFF